MKSQSRKLHHCLFAFILTMTASIVATQLRPCSLRTPLPKAVVPAITVSSQDEQDTPDRIRLPADDFLDQDTLHYHGYTIQRLSRKVRPDYPKEAEWVDARYVQITGSRLLRRFDAGLYFGLGNSADVAFFPFLGGARDQLFISQDVPRGGCQWVVSLSPEFRVIFDGQKFGVGREPLDLKAIDLDSDGVYEIVLPITDFYALQDKMSISEIPLPDLVFKYDEARKEYLPANPAFRDYLLNGKTHFVEVFSDDALYYRSQVLHTILPLIYAGERESAWIYFNKTYVLPDKRELRRRVKSILSRQPVYNFIYQRNPKS